VKKKTTVSEKSQGKSEDNSGSIMFDGLLEYIKNNPNIVLFFHFPKRNKIL
jgi:hypothetical protein